MSRFLHATVALTAILLCLGTAGCRSSEPARKESASTKPATTARSPAATSAPATTTGPAAAQAPGLPAVDVQGTSAGQINQEVFQADLKALTANPHRLAGLENGSLAAGKYVEQRLRSMGIQEVYTQQFPVIQPVYTECRLFVDGQEILPSGLRPGEVGLRPGEAGDSQVIYPVRPNLLQASVTPAEGLEGETVYAGRGETPEYGATLPQGRIVVLDFNCSRNWLTAFALGAKAVIFVGSDQPAKNVFQHLNLPANLPRFYVTAETAKRLELTARPRKVKIQAACQWKEFAARNVIGVIRGTDPSFGSSDISGHPAAARRGGDPSPQTIVLAAPLDSLSEIPDLSPGARDAANGAALLQTAEYLLKNRPRRDIVIAFFDGQTQNHAGAREFYGALYRQMGSHKSATYSIEETMDMLKEETAFYDKVLNIIRQKELFDPKTRELRSHDEAVRILREESRVMGSNALEELRRLRLKREDYKLSTDYRERKIPVPYQLQMQINRTEAEDLGWNHIQRYLHDRETLESSWRQFLLADGADKSLTPAQREKLTADVDALRGQLARDTSVPTRLKAMIDFLEAQGKVLGNPDAWTAATRDLQEYQKLRGQLEQTLKSAGEAKEGQGSPSLRDGSPQALAQAKALESLDRMKRFIDDTPPVKRFLELCDLDVRVPILSRMVDDLHTGRQEEIKQQLGRLAGSLALRKALSDHGMILLHVSINFSDGREYPPQAPGTGQQAPGKSDKAPGISAYSLVPSACRWCVIHGDDSLPTDNDKLGDYNPIFRLMLEVRGQIKDKMPSFDERPISQTVDNRLFAPGRFADSGAAARVFAIFNVSLMTVLDRMDRQGQPCDTVAALNLRNIITQADQAMPFLKGLADSPLTLTSRMSDAQYMESKWSGNKRAGASIKRPGAGAGMTDLPVRGAIVAVMYRGTSPFVGAAVENLPPGFVYPMIVKSDSLGFFDAGVHSAAYYNGSLIIAATFDKAGEGLPAAPESRALKAPGGGAPIPSRGLIHYISNRETAPQINGLARTFAVMLTEATNKSIVGYGYDRGGTATVVMRALSTAPFQDAQYLLCEDDNVLAIYAPVEAKGIKLFNPSGMAILNNKNNKDDYVGVGISMADPFEHPITPLLTSHDLRTLNEYRMDLLRRNHISEESLDVLNGTAKDIEEDALGVPAASNGGEVPVKAAPAGFLTANTGTGNEGPEGPKGYATLPRPKNVDEYYGDLCASAAYSRRVYLPLVGVMNDLVTAVVLLLLLAIPFAFALERLIIGTPHIYRQIGWFTAFFLATFGLLYTVNPAFKIASTPIIIFLAFAIILLSSLVIFIMVRKLQSEVRKMQGLATTVHSADVSRLGTMMAAVNMGISTMRRRWLRTTLTATTVVLLTFTILTFASFGSRYDARATYQGPMNGSTFHILVRHQLWSPISKDIYDTLRGHLAREATVVPRYWVSPSAQEAQGALNNSSLDMLLADEDASKAFTVSAAMGLDPVDLQWQPELSGLLDGQADLLNKDGIFITKADRDALGLTDQDAGKAKILLAGHKFTFAGTFKDAMATATMLEGSSLLPVDYQTSAGNSAEGFRPAETTETTTMTERPGMESAQFVRYNVEKVVVISPRAAMEMGGRIRAVNIYPKPQQTEAFSANIRALASRVAKVSALPTYVGDSSGVTRLFFTSVAQASGVKDLLIPVLLGGLIIFATMLGSVSDREREIYTFSSLGLAPPHIASLFFAEASMYAVIGGMGGYLLGQLVARLVAASGSNLAMNYSSTNAIVTVLIVMCTVLISTIYPARKASRSANPGIQRQWRIPKPQGNLYDLIFPFTVSAYDITGVVSFLREHFDNYSDTSLGVFATTACHIFRQRDNEERPAAAKRGGDPGMLGFRATVALAPFDLGVNQNFALLSQPSEIEGIDEVRILIYRLSGAQGDWQRSNRVFINDLRKQLLIWRSLPADIMDRYRQRTLEIWDALPCEQALGAPDGVDGQSIGGQV